MATILLVEIALDFSRNLVELLTNEGFIVIATRDSEEAERIFKAVGPDFVLLGLSLPTNAGLQVLAHIDLVTRTRKIPAIVVTNEWWTKRQLSEAHEHGASEHRMDRTCDFAPLILKVKEVLTINQRS